MDNNLYISEDFLKKMCESCCDGVTENGFKLLTNYAYTVIAEREGISPEGVPEYIKRKMAEDMLWKEKK